MQTKFNLGDVVYIPMVIDQITAKYNEDYKSVKELQCKLLFRSKTDRYTSVVFALEDELLTREDILNADKV